MSIKQNLLGPALALALALAAIPAGATVPSTLQDRLVREARAADPAFKGFSAARGEKLFHATHGGEWSCASCHTPDPRATGKHARTQKAIEPLAPVANPKRLVDETTIEKWFRRNCNDVLSRACTAVEKGDVLQYLTSLERK